MKTLITDSKSAYIQILKQKKHVKRSIHNDFNEDIDTSCLIKCLEKTDIPRDNYHIICNYLGSYTVLKDKKRPKIYTVKGTFDIPENAKKMGDTYWVKKILYKEFLCKNGERIVVSGDISDKIIYELFPTESRVERINKYLGDVFKYKSDFPYIYSLCKY
jgi:hypothetical protein